MDPIHVTFNEWKLDEFDIGEITLTASQILKHPQYVAQNVETNTDLEFDVCMLKFEEDLLAEIDGAAKACIASEFPEGTVTLIFNFLILHPSWTSLLDSRMGIIRRLGDLSIR